MKAYSQHNRQTASYTSAMIQETLLNQSEQIAYQQEQLNNLGKGFRDIAEILQKQHQSNPTRAIEETNQGIMTLSNGMISLVKQIRQVDFGQGFADIKAQQQTISRSVITTHKTLDSQAENLASYLGWKRVVIIVVSTAIITSIFNVASASLAPWAIGQIPGKSQQNNIEKSPPIVKKQKGDRSR
jgi:hypothetical protein